MRKMLSYRFKMQYILYFEILWFKYIISTVIKDVMNCSLKKNVKNENKLYQVR